jgi:hypothetical protein
MRPRIFRLIGPLLFCVVLVPLIVIHGSDPPSVVLEIGNFQGSLEHVIVDEGVIAWFCCNLSFTVTNIGNQTSLAFTILVEPNGAQYEVDRGILFTIEPIEPNQTRLVKLTDYTATAYPKLQLLYPLGTWEFRFGDNQTIREPATNIV